MSITYDPTLLKDKAEAYCQYNNLVITSQLGSGTQGIIFKTDSNTALKVHSLQNGYLREFRIYERFKEKDISSVRGMKIPRIKDWNDELYIIEMSIVHVPCILDFGGAYLDHPPDHVDRRDGMWLSAKRNEFGDNWDEAQAVIRELEHKANIWLADINNRNIKFSEKI